MFVFACSWCIDLLFCFIFGQDECTEAVPKSSVVVEEHDLEERLGRALQTLSVDPEEQQNAANKQRLTNALQSYKGARQPPTMRPRHANARFEHWQEMGIMQEIAGDVVNVVIGVSDPLATSPQTDLDLFHKRSLDAMEKIFRGARDGSSSADPLLTRLPRDPRNEAKLDTPLDKAGWLKRVYTAHRGEVAMLPAKQDTYLAYIFSAFTCV